MNSVCRAIALVACMSALVVAQTSKPSIDRSTPRGAARALAAAIEAGDETAIRDLLFAADDDQRKLSEALAGVVAASSRLSAAANARFGNSGDPIAGKAFSPADLSGIDSAPLQEDGDRATIELPDRDRPLALQRGDDGLWRVDLLAFSGATLEQLPQQLAMLHEFSAALSQLALDTDEARFATIADLKAAIQDRVHGTIARSMRLPRPATAPATSPTTAPGS
ncbi:hypothetical protein BH09PLA1_BH09PLA1_29900 [soil metagenome]